MESMTSAVLILINKKNKKTSLISDSQQFHHCHENEQLPLTSNIEHLLFNKMLFSDRSLNYVCKLITIAIVSRPNNHTKYQSYQASTHFVGLHWSVGQIVLTVPYPSITFSHDIADKMLKVTMNTHKPNQTIYKLSPTCSTCIVRSP